MTKQLNLCFALIVLVSPVFTALSFAQVDPEKALIGKWEGQAEVAKNRERAIVIDSVKATGSGEWIGYADGGKTEIDISKKDNEIYLEWTGAGGGKAPYRVKMVGDNKMEGTVEAFEKGRSVPRRITFEKVKAGDIK
jgi:hypothetical protein